MTALGVHGCAVVMGVQIDGLSGTGKSTLCNELTHRGYRAVDSDTRFAYSGDPTTGQPTKSRTRSNWVWDVNKGPKFCTNSHVSTLPEICAGGAPRNVGHLRRDWLGDHSAGLGRDPSSSLRGGLVEAGDR